MPRRRIYACDLTPIQATAEQAIARNDTVPGYNVSNTRAEAAAWQFMEKAKPGFDLTGINPDIITGPMIHPIHGPKSINETKHFAIASFIDGTHKRIEGVTFLFYHFVCFKASVRGSLHRSRGLTAVFRSMSVTLPVVMSMPSKTRQRQTSAFFSLQDSYHHSLWSTPFGKTSLLLKIEFLRETQARAWLQMSTRLGGTHGLV